MTLSLFDKILYYIMFPILCIGSILSPLTNDVRIFYSVEYLCWKYISDFPSNINYFWEIKPIGNHIINYILVIITNLFIPFENHIGQEILIKAIAVGIAIIACWLFARNVLKIKYGFLLCFFGMFCGLNVNILQSEWWAIALAMISCALFMETKNYWHYIAGALLIFVLLAKGTTGCLVVSAICIVMIAQKNIDYIRSGIGFVATGLAFYAASLTIWPTMLSDIFMAPILSHVGEYNMISQIGVTAIATAISMSIYIPCVGLGFVYGIVWLKNHTHDSRTKWFVLSWLSPLFIVWIQSESFPYQYYVFLLPAIIGLVLYETDTPKEKKGKLNLKRENIIATSIIILFAMWCILYSPQPIGGLEQNYGVQELKMNNYFWKNSNEMEVKFNLSKEKTLLYLDTGSGPYYVGVNSSCRYVAPLILQRANPGRLVVSNLTEYWNAYNCTMNYNGKYILADGPLGKDDGWFGMDTLEKRNIANKIKSEYNEVFTGAWSVYERKND